MIKRTITLLAVLTLFTACAVKQDDNLATKTLKHTANAPFYVIAGVGIATTLAVQGALIGTAKVLGVKPKEKKDTKSKESLENKKDEDIQ